MLLIYLVAFCPLPISKSPIYPMSFRFIFKQYIGTPICTCIYRDLGFGENLFTLNEVIYIVLPTTQIAHIYLDKKKVLGLRVTVNLFIVSVL